MNSYIILKTNGTGWHQVGRIDGTSNSDALKKWLDSSKISAPESYAVVAEDHLLANMIEVRAGFVFYNSKGDFISGFPA